MNENNISLFMRTTRSKGLKISYHDVGDLVVISVEGESRNKVNRSVIINEVVVTRHILHASRTIREVIVTDRDMRILGVGFVKLMRSMGSFIPVCFVNACSDETYCKLLLNMDKWCKECVYMLTIHKLSCSEPALFRRIFVENPYLPRVISLYYYRCGI